MTDNTPDENKSVITKTFVAGSGVQDGALLPLFTPDEMDIYVNKITGENYIFYGKKIDTDIKHIEFDHESCRMTVEMNDGRRMDLGVRIQWLIRPYIKKEQEIAVVRTKDGETIDGITVPVIHTNKEDEA